MKELNNLFNEELSCVNLGLESFDEALKEQGVLCIHVQWKPPARGNVELIKILDWIEN